MICSKSVYFLVFIFYDTSPFQGVTMLQARMSPVQVPDEMVFFNLPNTSSRTTALMSTKPVREMSTRNHSGGKGRPARKVDNLAAIYEPNV
jgi:hypothetical protein